MLKKPECRFEVVPVEEALRAVMDNAARQVREWLPKTQPYATATGQRERTSKPTNNAGGLK